MKIPPPDLPPPDLPPPVTPSVPVSVPAAKLPVASAHDPYAPPKSSSREEKPEEPDLEFASGSWGGVVKEALTYPVRGSNIIGLFLAGLVVLCVSVMIYAFIIGIAAFLGGMAYIAAYYFEVVQHTINGKSDTPAWPDLSSIWDDIVIPGFQMLVITTLTYLPLGLVHWVAQSEYFGVDGLAGNLLLLLRLLFVAPEIEGTGLKLLAWGSHLFAWAYFPMATLAIVCSGTVRSALPDQVFPAIRRCLPGYGLCILLFGLAEIAQGLAKVMVGGVPVLGMLLPGLVGVYGLLVQARLAGMIYLRSSEKLPW